MRKSCITRILAFAILVVIVSAGMSSESRAQEFIDTVGRWKNIPLGKNTSPVTVRAIAAWQGHVVVSRDNGSWFFSPDSGETWTNISANLPSGANAAWSFVYPDTAANPSRLLGIATFGIPAKTVWVIESTDGGQHWAQKQELPQLDSLFTFKLDDIILQGPPVIQFAPSATGGGKVGFITSAMGMLVSTDDGATWKAQGQQKAYRSLGMFDSQHGVAAFGDRTAGTNLVVSTGGIFATTDGGTTWTQSYTLNGGGFYQFISILPLSATNFRVIVPDRFSAYQEWSLLTSYNGGMSWNEFHGHAAWRPLSGRAFWRDSNDIHFVTDGAGIEHSPNGGKLIYMLRDTTIYWELTDLDAVLGYIVKTPAVAMDNKYLYLAAGNGYKSGSPGGVARWRMAASERLAEVQDTRAITGEDALAFYPNPARGGEAATVKFSLMTAGPVELEIVDLLGRRLIRQNLEHLEPGTHTVKIECTGLAAGSYRLVVVGGKERHSIPVTVMK